MTYSLQSSWRKRIDSMRKLSKSLKNSSKIPIIFLKNGHWWKSLRNQTEFAELLHILQENRSNCVVRFGRSRRTLQELPREAPGKTLKETLKEVSTGRAQRITCFKIKKSQFSLFWKFWLIVLKMYFRKKKKNNPGTEKKKVFSC